MGNACMRGISEMASVELTDNSFASRTGLHDVDDTGVNAVVLFNQCSGSSACWCNVSPTAGTGVAAVERTNRCG